MVNGQWAHERPLPLIDVTGFLNFMNVFGACHLQRPCTAKVGGASTTGKTESEGEQRACSFNGHKWLRVNPLSQWFPL